LKKTVAFLLFSVLALLCFSMPVSAEEEYFPSVFIADDVWYKDRSQPLVKEASNLYYLPAEAFGALPKVTVITDTEARALRLSSPAGTFSVDTENGTIISPEGDSTLRVLNTNGTTYLHVFDTCTVLGLNFEIHVYASGAEALRINDGSGMLGCSTLVRMFAEQRDTASRMSGLPTNERIINTVTVSTIEQLENSAENAELGASFILVLDAELVLFCDNAEAFCAAMTKIYAHDLPISLFCQNDSGATELHYMRQANLRLAELFRRGTTLCTAARPMTEDELDWLASAGFMLTEFTLEEEK